MAMAYEELFASNKDVLASLLPEKLRCPRVGIVCGSGLSTLAASLRETVEVPYSSLRGFGKSTGRNYSPMYNELEPDQRSPWSQEHPCVRSYGR